VRLLVALSGLNAQLSHRKRRKEQQYKRKRRLIGRT
jgi:hypothetical protein